MSRLSFLALLCLLSLSACAPTLRTRGNLVANDRLQGIEAGVTSKQEVEHKLGSPTATDPFDQNLWFYIGETTESKAFFRPKVTARRVLKVQFDETGTLTNIAEVDEKAGKTVDLVKKATPAGGQEMNVFQQFMGNLGKFNSNQMGGGGAGGKQGQ
jgi:outer membrane protein assembly factor BamE (lipoprotein component of BamABCDE complex)